MQYIRSMPFSLRLSKDGEAKLDELMAMGGFGDKSETVRTALNLLYTVLLDQREGIEFVSMPQEEAKALPRIRTVRRPVFR